MIATRHLLSCLLALLTALLVPNPAAAGTGDALAGRPICTLEPGQTIDAAAIFTAGGRASCAARGAAKVRSGQWRLVNGLSLAADAHDPWVIRWQNIFADRVTIVARYADGQTRQIVQTDRAVGEAITVNATIVHTLPARASPITDLAMRIDGGFANRDQSRYFTVVPASHAMHDARVHLLIWGLFAGIALAMLAYNLMLWTVLRFRFLLVYCVSVASILLYGISWSGGVFLLDPGISGSTAMRINFLLLSMLGASVLWFMSSFFERWALPRAARLGLGAIACSLIAAGLLFMFAPRAHIALFDRVYYSAFTLAIPSVPLLCVLAWRRGSQVLWLFVAAWSVPIISSTLRLLNGYDLIPSTIALGNGTFYSMCFESLVSTFGIAYRIRRIQRERDIAQAERMDLKRLADTDPLTNLLNRRAFLRDAVRGDTQAVHRLALLDIDHFKGVNDRHGHLTGDAVLKDFAMLLVALAPSDAIVGRLGGEEFAVLMPAHGHASDFAADFLTALRALDCAEGVRVTASIGVAESRLTTDEDWAALYKAADVALYEAKDAGRNRARIHQPATDADTAAAAA